MSSIERPQGDNNPAEVTPDTSPIDLDAADTSSDALFVPDMGLVGPIPLVDPKVAEKNTNGESLS